MDSSVENGECNGSKGQRVQWKQWRAWNRPLRHPTWEGKNSQMDRETSGFSFLSLTKHLVQKGDFGDKKLERMDGSRLVNWSVKLLGHVFCVLSLSEQTDRTWRSRPRWRCCRSRSWKRWRSTPARGDPACPSCSPRPSWRSLTCAASVLKVRKPCSSLVTGSSRPQ